MSIITDALKKAEEERQTKTVPSVENLLIEVENEQAELLKRFGYTNQPEPAPQASTLRIERPNHFFSAAKNVLIALALLSLCFVVVYLIPRSLILANSVSNVWSNIKDSAYFNTQPAPAPVSVPEIIELVPLPESVTEVKVEIPVPEVIPPKPELAYTLSGVSFLGQDRYAVVNGVILQKGDAVDEATVKEITDREVVLETPTGEVRLKISR